MKRKAKATVCQTVEYLIHHPGWLGTKKGDILLAVQSRDGKRLLAIIPIIFDGKFWRPGIEAYELARRISRQPSIARRIPNLLCAATRRGKRVLVPSRGSHPVVGVGVSAFA